MPIANIVVMSEEPPDDTSGRPTPMTGSMPMTEPMLTMAWLSTHAMMPAAAIRTKSDSARVTMRTHT